MLLLLIIGTAAIRAFLIPYTSGASDPFLSSAALQFTCLKRKPEVPSETS